MRRWVRRVNSWCCLLGWWANGGLKERKECDGGEVDGGYVSGIDVVPGFDCFLVPKLRLEGCCVGGSGLGFGTRSAC